MFIFLKKRKANFFFPVSHENGVGIWKQHMKPSCSFLPKMDTGHTKNFKIGKQGREIDLGGAKIS
jgi:hypothetical protein